MWHYSRRFFMANATTTLRRGTDIAIAAFSHLADWQGASRRSRQWPRSLLSPPAPRPGPHGGGPLISWNRDQNFPPPWTVEERALMQQTTAQYLDHYRAMAKELAVSVASGRMQIKDRSRLNQREVKDNSKDVPTLKIRAFGAGGRGRKKRVEQGEASNEMQCTLVSPLVSNC